MDRRTDPANRRSKLVSLTEARREMLDAAGAVEEPAPLRFDALSDDEVASLAVLLPNWPDKRTRTG